MATTTPEIGKLSLDDATDKASAKLLALKNGQDTTERTFPAWNAEDPYDPCNMCGSTPFRFHWYSKDFTSTIRVLATMGSRATWTLGDKFVIKERGQELPRNEVINAKFVRENTSIPAPAVVLSWDDGDKTFIIQERVHGVTLADHWDHMTEDQRQEVGKELAAYMTQLRKLTSDKMQTVAGGPVSLAREEAFGPSTSADDMFESMVTPEAGYKNLPPSQKTTLREHLPPLEPFTFTHMDIEAVNVLVGKDDCKLKAIIDWEFGAYLPVWWEYAKFMKDMTCEDDQKFKEMVAGYLPEADRYEKALLWLEAYEQCHDNWRIHDPEDMEAAFKKLVEYDCEAAKKKPLT